MAVTKKGKFVIVFAVVLPILLATLLIINWFVYPFVSAKPNFADVEAVYNKMVVPADWVKKGEGANKGIAGRQCPIESDGCFSKSAEFSVPNTVTESDIKKVYESMGCVSVVADRSEPKGAKPYTDFECSAGPLVLGGTLDEGYEPWRLTIGVGTR